jgi:hypothetical protein
MTTQKQTNAPAIHHAYMLRMWRENEHKSYRFCLKDARTAQDHVFVSLEAMMIYLTNLTTQGEKNEQERSS